VITKAHALQQWRKDPAMLDQAQELVTRHLHRVRTGRPRPTHGGQEPAQGPSPTAHGPTLEPPLSGLFDTCSGLLDALYWAGAIPVRLETFVGFLQDHGILPASPEYSFDQQERLQKCAFIAQAMFHLNLGYRYYLHAYGTFSTTLAIDFSRIVKKRTPTSGLYIPDAFQAKKFVPLVSGRSLDWLAAASAVLYEGRSPHTSGSSLSRLFRVTGAYNKLLVYRVAGALAKSGPTLPKPDSEDDDNA